MTEEQRAEIKKALIKCAEENEGKNTFTGYVIVSSVCKAGAERIAELEAQIEKMKCYLPVSKRDSDHKWFAYKNLSDTKWKIDYSVQGELPKCNTIKWFENKEAVMFYLVSNGMEYYKEPRR